MAISQIRHFIPKFIGCIAEINKENYIKYLITEHVGQNIEKLHLNSDLLKEAFISLILGSVSLTGYKYAHNDLHLKMWL